MTDKRFKLSSETVLQYQIMDNDTDLNENEVVDLLNEMFEKLNKKQEKSVELFFKYKKLKEENEQLRKQLDFYLLDEFEWKEKYGDVLDE